MTNATVFLEYSGFCPICEKPARFKANGHWLRGTLLCQSCINGSVPRERALALVLKEMVPNWRILRVHESSPVNRGISAKLKSEARDLMVTQFFPDVPLGVLHNGFRNEDLQRQTFEDEDFDLFISLDVFEHVPDPQLAIEEIWRTLKIGGIMLCTFPIRKAQVVPMERRARFEDDGSITHLKEAEYHGNPISAEGSLVTVDYGYDVHQLIADWASFDVRIYRFHDKTYGILGEYTEVIFCKKMPLKEEIRSRKGT